MSPGPLRHHRGSRSHIHCPVAGPGGEGSHSWAFGKTPASPHRRTKRKCPHLPPPQAGAGCHQAKGLSRASGPTLLPDKEKSGPSKWSAWLPGRQSSAAGTGPRSTRHTGVTRKTLKRNRIFPSPSSRRGPFRKTPGSTLGPSPGPAPTTLPLPWEYAGTRTSCGEFGQAWRREWTQRES